MSISAATHYGSSASDHSMTGDRTLVAGSARMQVVSPSAGLAVILPDARKLRKGRSFVIVNVSANSVDVKDAAGTVVKAVAATKGALCHLVDNGSAAGTWAVATRSIL